MRRARRCGAANPGGEPAFWRASLGGATVGSACFPTPRVRVGILPTRCNTQRIPAQPPMISFAARRPVRMQSEMPIPS
jgi:hypothetical protein